MRRLLLVVALVVSLVGGAGAVSLVPAGSAAQAAETLLPERGAVQLASRSAVDPSRSADGASRDADLTPDARYTVFASTARDLTTSPPANGLSQIYLRDSVTGGVQMISTVAGGSAAGDGDSSLPSISDDGQVVAFLTRATNLATGVTASAAQAVTWSRGTGRIELASVTSDVDRDPANVEVTDVDLAGSGTVIAYVTTATNLTPTPTYNKPQVYRRDLVSRATQLLSVSAAGVAAASGATSPSVSRDGRAVAFTAVGLEIEGAVSEHRQVILWQEGVLPSRIMSSVSSERVGGNADSTSPSISADGSSVAFASDATDLVSWDPRGHTQIFVRSVSSSWAGMVSWGRYGANGSNGRNSAPTLSADGSTVAYISEATDAVPVADRRPQLLVSTQFGRSLRLVDRGPGGEAADGPPDKPVLSRDGGIVAFGSQATNLAAGTSGDQIYLGSTVRGSTVERIGGVDRYAVSAAISASTFCEGAPVAFVASGQGFPDALAGAAAAGRMGGPVLLVTKDAVPAPVTDELRRLQPAKIIVLGGLNTIGPGVELSLRGLAPDVSRVAGTDRYAGAALLAERVFGGVSGTPNVPVLVASGENFPDALAGSALAGVYAGALLLTRRDELPAVVAEEIAQLHPSVITILGGEGSVSTAVEATLNGIASTRRISGADRYGTAAAVSKDLFFFRSTVYIASGETFPDALAGSAAAIDSSSPVLLVSRTSIPDETLAQLLRLRPSRIVVLGGPATIADSVLADLAPYLAP